MASAAKLIFPIPIFLAYLIPLDVDVKKNNKNNKNNNSETET
jgi:hypothetical protein